jgi:uncharacterized membrane protein YqgA involved in biofilm formation
MEIGTGIAVSTFIVAIMAIILKMIPSRKGDIYNKELCETVHAQLIGEVAGLKKSIDKLFDKIDALTKRICQ